MNKPHFCPVVAFQCILLVALLVNYGLGAEMKVKVGKVPLGNKHQKTHTVFFFQR